MMLILQLLFHATPVLEGPVTRGGQNKDIKDLWMGKEKYSLLSAARVTVWLKNFKNSIDKLLEWIRKFSKVAKNKIYPIKDKLHI